MTVNRSECSYCELETSHWVLYDPLTDKYDNAGPLNIHPFRPRGKTSHSGSLNWTVFQPLHTPYILWALCLKLIYFHTLQFNS